MIRKPVMNKPVPAALESLYDCLVPWEAPVSAGFTLRGWYTPPRGRPLIHFIHGNGFCTLTYAPFLAALAGDYDLFLSDVQGHGDSDHGRRFRGWNRTADLCTEVWEQFSGQWQQVPVYGVGHSFGGVVTALMMARRRRLFDRAVLLDPVLFSPRMIGVMALSDVAGLWKLNTMARRARKRRRHWPDRAAVWKSFHERGMFRGWTEAALSAHIDNALKPDGKGGLTLKCRPSMEAALFGSYPRRLWPSLDRVATPTKVIYGRDSYPFVAESAHRWIERNPKVESQEVRGGHCFMQEYPEEAARQTLLFLARR